MGDIGGFEEPINLLNSTLDFIQDTLFGTWDVGAWETIQPLTKLIRFQYFWLFSLAGKVEVVGDKIVLHFKNEDYNYPIPEITRKIPSI